MRRIHRPEYANEINFSKIGIDLAKNVIHHKTRYQGLATNAAQLFSLFGLANLVLARRWLLGANGQGAT